MEEVVGFPGYIWCRDCHITKKVEEGELTSEDCRKEIETES
ncbi:MAG: hypothetical protein R6W73_10115 [Candidatus Saliniplasma sp.]